MAWFVTPLTKHTILSEGPILQGAKTVSMGVIVVGKFMLPTPNMEQAWMFSGTEK